MGEGSLRVSLCGLLKGRLAAHGFDPRRRLRNNIKIVPSRSDDFVQIYRNEQIKPINLSPFYVIRCTDSHTNVTERCLQHFRIAIQRSHILLNLK